MKSLLARIAAIIVAAALVIGLAVLYARASRPRLRGPREGGNPETSEMLRRFRLRPRGPQLSRVGGFAGQCVLLALIAMGGRYILRIRL
ncbi:MAG TPA: hypothetical protein VKB79_17880 [Bryobacteraceae bacterium]|nr:hypothetical protein [Bryobacteraceae bacterium]